jgi:hypothetical protein
MRDTVAVVNTRPLAETAVQKVTGTNRAAAARDKGPTGPYRFEPDFLYSGRNEGDPDMLVATCEVDGLRLSIDLVLGEDGQQIRPRRITFELPEDEPALPSSRALRRLGLADVQDQLLGELKRPTWLWGLPAEWAQALLSPSRRGRRETPDHEYALWALRYVEALEVNPEHPMSVLVEWFGDLYSRAAMAAYIHKARGRQLLTKTTDRRPGGRLTKKAERALDQISPEVKSWRP